MKYWFELKENGCSVGEAENNLTVHPAESKLPTLKKMDVESSPWHLTALGGDYLESVESIYIVIMFKFIPTRSGSACKGSI